MPAPKPVVLIVLDGWGYTDETRDNAIAGANTPVWDHLWKDYPHTLIDSSGEVVGLPSDQMGNSEVGHLNLGAGRIVYQEYTRIANSIRTGVFFKNPALTHAIDQAVAQGKSIHVIGLLSPGGVHSHETHIHAALSLAAQRGATRLFLHAILDGRDTPPQSAEGSIRAVDTLFGELGVGKIASVIGRYYAMDRDKRWERTQAAYDLIAEGKAIFSAASGLDAVHSAYERGETDEFVNATSINTVGEQAVTVADGDVVINMNYRADRARQITRAFIDPAFDGFQRSRQIKLGTFVCLTRYSETFDTPVAFAPEAIRNTLGEYLALRGMKQLRLAETEKYAHVTFFFNGGREAPFPGEDRILVPSPKVATYDLQPQMSAPEVTDRLVEAIREAKYDLVVCNYANPDMVGHTGYFDAAVAAIEAVDTCLGRVYEACRETGGEILITADHGNAEKMRDSTTNQPHTAHTCNLVPFIYIGRPAQVIGQGSLADVAPTLLHIMGLPQPAEMTGHSLIRLTGQDGT